MYIYFHQISTVLVNLCVIQNKGNFENRTKDFNCIVDQTPILLRDNRHVTNFKQIMEFFFPVRSFVSQTHQFLDQKAYKI